MENTNAHLISESHGFFLFLFSLGNANNSRHCYEIMRPPKKKNPDSKKPNRDDDRRAALEAEQEENRLRLAALEALEKENEARIAVLKNSIALEEGLKKYFGHESEDKNK